MEYPFIKTELVGPGPFDFWRTKLYDLREAVYRHMDKTGACPICAQSTKPHADDCAFAKIEMEIVEYARKATGRDDSVKGGTP